MSNVTYLIDEPKYSFLKDLGLDKVNDGVYNGRWFGSGEVRESYFACLLSEWQKATVRLKVDINVYK